MYQWNRLDSSEINLSKDGQKIVNMDAKNTQLENRLFKTDGGWISPCKRTVTDPNLTTHLKIKMDLNF